MRNILIIEDDKILNKGVAFALKKEGYNVISAYTKQEGKTAVDNNEIDFFSYLQILALFILIVINILMFYNDIKVLY